MRKFKVGTFCRKEDRDAAENRGRFIKRDVLAYTYWYGSDWDELVEYVIEAKSGTEAKKIAIEMRIRDEQYNVELKGWGWWREDGK